MENFSKNKRKAGRPRTAKNEVALIVASTFNLGNPENTTERSKINAYYSWVAGFKLLFVDVKTHELKHPEFHFLCHDFLKPTQKYKQTIIGAIARVADEYGEEAALSLAKEICEEKMTTKQALYFIGDFKRDSEPDRVFAIFKQLCTVMKNSRLTIEEAHQVKNLFNGMFDFEE